MMTKRLKSTGLDQRYQTRIKKAAAVCSVFVKTALKIARCIGRNMQKTYEKVTTKVESP